MTHSDSSTQKSISPLYCAVNNGHIDACILLLEHGVDLNHICSGLAMTRAIDHGYTDICRLLLDYGMNPNAAKCDFTYIYHSICHNRIDIVELLLDKGACMGIYKSYVSPLAYAVSRQCYDICLLLLDRGADPNECEDNDPLKNRTAIYEAVANCNGAICKLLLSRGAVVSSDYIRSDEDDMGNLERAYFLIDIMGSMRM